MSISVLEVPEVADNNIRVKGIDMLYGTPVLEIKPHIEKKCGCPTYHSEEKYSD